MFRLRSWPLPTRLSLPASWYLAFAACAAFSAACTQCGDVPPGSVGDGGSLPRSDGGTFVSCENESDCPSDHMCANGLCRAKAVDAGSELDAGGGGAGDDASVPESRLDVLPGLELEFGAQLLGVTVTRELILQNGGNADLTVFAVILDDDSGEFEATPTGTLSERLRPGEALVVTVSHTPADGIPDFAELKVLHDGPSSLANIELFAEFKGDAALSLSTELEVTMPNVEMLDFGEVFPGETVERTMWVRNTGRSDSILTISDITLTPESAGFTWLDEMDLPYPLGAWSAAACVDDVAVCPPSSAACEDGVCVDEAGAPVFALPLRISYTAADAPASATLTLEHDAAGIADTQTDVLLAGTPSQPELSASTTELNFGPVLVGGPVGLLRFQVDNQGAGPLRISRLVPPQNSVFSVTSSPSLPSEAGQLPFILAPDDAPIEVEVTFTPHAADSFAGFVKLQSNDPTSPEYTVTISGTGISCQAHAHVSAAGVCECDAGYRDCAGECLLAGPDACGPSCIRCDERGGATRECVADQCEYSCTRPYYDLNDDLGQAQGQTSDGCEYLCSQNPAQAEQCNSVDDDCDGEIDNGLPADAKENNNSCSNRKTLTQVNTGGTSQFSTYSIYPLGDDDWYQIRVNEENDNICVYCIDCESYSTQFELIDQPDNQDYVLEVRRLDAGCGSTQLPSTRNGKKVVDDWSACPSFWACSVRGEDNHGCGSQDYKDYIVRVRPRDGNQTNQSCETYTLQVSHSAND